jgi:hypothetical protein
MAAKFKGLLRRHIDACLGVFGWGSLSSGGRVKGFLSSSKLIVAQKMLVLMMGLAPV